jgi:hypothetical protein
VQLADLIAGPRNICRFDGRARVDYWHGGGVRWLLGLACVPVLPERPMDDFTRRAHAVQGLLSLEIVLTGFEKI